MYVPCLRCPLRKSRAFTRVKAEELAFIQAMKSEHRTLEAGSTIIYTGQEKAELFTLFSGWAYRFRSLEDGRRQILNFLLPGDLVGLQASMFAGALYDIAALTRVELCVFPRGKIWSLFQQMPELSFDVTWLGAREESIVDDNLTTVGIRNASERVAALIISLFKRVRALGLVVENSFDFPLSQQHIAHALGLSLVHTNKTISGLKRLGMFSVVNGRLTLHNPRALQRIAQHFDDEVTPRPLI